MIDIALAHTLFLWFAQHITHCDKLHQVGAKAKAVEEEAKGVEEEDNGKFKQVFNNFA